MSEVATINPENDLTHDPRSNIAFFRTDEKGMLRVNIDTLQEYIKDDQAELYSRRDELLAAAAVAPLVVADAETEERMLTLEKAMQAVLTTAEKRRTDYKEPFLNGGRAVDAIFKRELADQITPEKAKINKVVTVWQRQVAAENRRKAEEEAARQAAIVAAAEAEAQRLAAEAREREADATTEAELAAAIARDEEARRLAEQAEKARNDLVPAIRAAEAKQADLSRARIQAGGGGSLRTFWDFDESTFSRENLDLEKLRPYFTIDELKKALRGFIRAGGRECGKVRIFENDKTGLF